MLVAQLTQSQMGGKFDVFIIDVDARKLCLQTLTETIRESGDFFCLLLVRRLFFSRIRFGLRQLFTFDEFRVVFHLMEGKSEQAEKPSLVDEKMFIGAPDSPRHLITPQHIFGHPDAIFQRAVGQSGQSFQNAVIIAQGIQLLEDR